jgi:hypothetical protein
MCKRTLLVIFLASLTVLVGKALMAQTPEGCLLRARYQLQPGQKIKVLENDGSKISGRFISVETESSVLYISQKIKDSTFSTSVKVPDIAMIRYSKASGKIRMEYAILGMLAGGFIGYMLDYKEPDLESWWNGDRAHQDGMAAGCVIGFLIGLAGSTAIPTEKTITCH